MTVPYVYDGRDGIRLSVMPEITVVGKWHYVRPAREDLAVPELTTESNEVTMGLAFAAKACYRSFGKDGRSCEENQRAIIESGHGSVLEHATVSLYIEGISRNLSLEMNRHRTFNISQESTRYVDVSDTAFVLEPYYANLYMAMVQEEAIEAYGEDADYVIRRFYEDLGMPNSEPRKLSDDEKTLLTSHISVLRHAQEQYVREVRYLELLNPLKLSGFHLRKWARGKARNILPGNLETRAVYTANLRAWRHFIELRSGEGAEPEIRRLAFEVYKKLKQIYPLYFEDYELRYNIPAGAPKYFPVYPEIVTPYRKV